MALTGVLALGDPNLSLGEEKGWDSLDLEFLGLKLLFIAAALCAGRAFVVPWGLPPVWLTLGVCGSQAAS
ncbi:hypothetical protein ACLM5J_18525, partial [Nocardioides sp. Bht2]|uniref:hypothetical protein n=1 Tax=Nocardioides sp. Bht2 TaxID=3392297 RepID=UPI0039B5651B